MVLVVVWIKCREQGASSQYLYKLRTLAILGAHSHARKVRLYCPCNVREPTLQQEVTLGWELVVGCRVIQVSKCIYGSVVQFLHEGSVPTHP
jgi:hypothetical protein